ncbi:hypothetical protein B0H34DRAFT_239880 [Crassisporium funariophilum]|nr:hypothetical protein B0H34DRAFT_239880 [Crassisporium funariophilum]
MKSVFRALRKWENKTAEYRDEKLLNSRNDNSKPLPPPPSLAPSGRTLTISLKPMPLRNMTAASIEGSWQPSQSSSSQPTSPIYAQYTESRDDRPIVRRSSSRFALDVTHRRQDPSRNEGRQTPNSIHQLSQNTTTRVGKSSTHASGRSQVSPPSSPKSPSFAAYQVLPHGTTADSPAKDCSVDRTSCKCHRHSQSIHHSQCPRYSFMDAQNSVASIKLGAELQASPKTVHAVLDLSVDANPRSLYFATGSTPYLPYKDKEKSVFPLRSDGSASSVDGSEDNFPLSLFPAPPPLVIRKKVPTPLVIRPMLPSQSSQSSRDSTPVGTPTTPRFPSLNSPSQSSICSPSKKYFINRPLARNSPPPFSPPNSPLPIPPVTREEEVRHFSVRPLRTARSDNNLRGALPFPATHRLNSSEPISDQSSSPIKRSTRPRPEGVRLKNLQSYTDLKEQPRETGMESHVQWGYAL